MRPLLVVPTVDEAGTIEWLLTALRALPAPTPAVLVVDDGSADGTAEIADRLAARDAGVTVLHRPGRQGLGSAYRTGFRWGLERSFDVFGEIDADGSHDPADVPRLLAALADADVVIGSRYVPGGGVADWPRHRRWLSRGGNAYVRCWTGLPVRDATSGFRCYRREVLEAIGLATVRSDGYAFQVEMALRAWRDGFRLVEVPITFTERREGRSKMSRAIVAEALWRVPVWGVRSRRARRP